MNLNYKYDIQSSNVEYIKQSKYQPNNEHQITYTKSDDKVSIMFDRNSNNFSFTKSELQEITNCVKEFEKLIQSSSKNITFAVGSIIIQDNKPIKFHRIVLAD